MKNAKKELLEKLDKCGKNLKDIDWLKIGFEEEDYERFDDRIKWNMQKEIIDIEFLDVEYYSGYGGQELYGLVVFKDGSRLERGEYDGAEWWEYKETPECDF